MSLRDSFFTSISYVLREIRYIDHFFFSFFARFSRFLVETVARCTRLAKAKRGIRRGVGFLSVATLMWVREIPFVVRFNDLLLFFCGSCVKTGNFNFCEPPDTSYAAPIDSLADRRKILGPVVCVVSVFLLSIPNEGPARVR